MDPQASIFHYHQPSAGTSANAYPREPGRGLSTQPAGPTAHRQTGQGHQQQQQPPEVKSAKPVPPRRRNSKTQSQFVPQEQPPAGAPQLEQDQGRGQEPAQPKSQEQLQPGAQEQLMFRPQDQLPAGSQAVSPPPLQAQSPPQSRSPPEIQSEATAQPDKGREQQATQAQGHPHLK